MGRSKQILSTSIIEPGRLVTEMGLISFKRYHKRVTKNYSPVVTADGRSLTVHIGGQLPEDDVRYDVYLDKVPAINTSFKKKNNASMTAPEIKNKNKVADIPYQFLDGDFNGEKYSYHSQKGEKWSSACLCCLCCDSKWCWWAKWEPSRQMRMNWYHHGLDQTSLYTVLQEIHQTGNVLWRTYPRSARTILGMYLHFLKDTGIKKKKQVSLAKKGIEWQWQPKMARVHHQKSQSISLANGVKVASKEVKSRCYRNLGLSFW